MNRDDILRMAREAGFAGGGCEALFRFAALVAKRAVSNIDPASWMSWQEGYAAGVAAEREACAKVCDDKAKETFSGQCQVWGDYFARAIRARSEK